MALVSQSSNIVINLGMQARGLPVAYVACLGNAAVVGLAELTGALLDDPRVTAVGLYIEGIDDAPAFAALAEKARAMGKGVVAIKSGKTELSRTAAASHTASLAGDDQVFGAAFRQSGIIRARDYEHMFGLARAISKQPLPDREGVFIITYAGSLGVIAADAITDNGMRLSDLEPHLKERLRRLLPDYVCGMNPVDYTFSQDAETVKKTIEIGVDSEDVGSFIVVLQAEILDSYVDSLKSIDYRGKPIIACVAGKEFALADVIKMEKAGIPVFSTPEEVADALAIMYRHQKRVKEQESTD